MRLNFFANTFIGGDFSEIREFIEKLQQLASGGEAVFSQR